MGKLIWTVVLISTLLLWTISEGNEESEQAETAAAPENAQAVETKETSGSAKAEEKEEGPTETTAAPEPVQAVVTRKKIIPAKGMKDAVECIKPDCTSLPQGGRCRGYFEVYFWNTTSSSCDKFVYGGCAKDLNCNRYRTLDSCNEACNKAEA